ncbi:MAG: glycosyltransferase [Chlorobiaceae bacterium]
MPETSTKQIIREEYPLVSIVVITYNSAKYVLETLESAKAQTYQNIELIVSDDCSTDNTLEICRNWIEENKTRFVRSEIIKTQKNTGVSGNCNRGLMASKGEWIKMIAGDDIMLPDCLLLFYSGSQVYPEVKCFLSQLYLLQGKIVDQIIKPRVRLFPKRASKQLLNVLRYGSLPALATFYCRNTLIDIGGFDEKYPSVEDYPLYVKLLRSGYHFAIVDKPTVVYRKHEESLTHSLQSPFWSCMKLYFSNVILPLTKEKKLYSLLWHHFLQEQYVESVSWKKNIISMTIRLTDYVYWRKKIMPIFRYSNYLLVRTLKIQTIHVELLKL